MRASSGKVPEEANNELKNTLQQQNFFLACCWKPDEDITIALPESDAIYNHATVTKINSLSDDIVQLLLEPTTPLYYHAGQYINLRSSDDLARSYSLASVPHHDIFLELHIKRMENGLMSNWIHDVLNEGDIIDFHGPIGHCFYIPDNIENNMLLLGTGTGLAPLIGIARDALLSDHKGDIYLYHGNRDPEGLYLHTLLENMTKEWSNFHYIPCVTGDDVPSGYRAMRASDAAFNDFDTLSNWRVYLCGNPPMVNGCKKKAYLKGASLDYIYGDPFELTDRRSKPRE